MRLLKYVFLLSLITILVVPQRSSAGGIPVTDIISNRKIDSIVDKLRWLHEQYETIAKTRLFIEAQLAHISDMGRYRSPFMPSDSFDFAFRGCPVGPWPAVLNLGQRGQEAMDFVSRTQDWTCSELRKTTPDILHDAKIIQAFDNINRDAFEYVGFSRVEQSKASGVVESLLNIVGDVSKEGRSPASNAQKAAVALAHVNAQLRDIQRTNSAILETYVMLLQQEREKRTKRVDMHVQWTKNARRAYSASGVSSPFTGL